MIANARCHNGIAAAGTRRPRVAVLGGSLIGLTTALVLRDIGCEVDVYERSPAPLEGRGVGIVLHPTTVRYLVQNRLLDLKEVSTSASVHRYLAHDGSVVSQVQRRHHFTGYNALYRTLLREFGLPRYHLGHEVTGLSPARDHVSFSFASGGTSTCELLVAADGIASTARRLLLPDLQPHYGGYVAWRGVVEESRLTPATLATLNDSLTYFVARNSHALTYPIPNYCGSVQVGRRLVNLVWYRNVPVGGELDELLTDRSGRRREFSVPPDAVRPQHVEELRSAAQQQLPPSLVEVVTKIRAPFLQVIMDVEVPQMAFGRVCLVGDAAFAVRPHAAAATAKGADDVWALADALVRCGGDVESALRAWEPAQLELGRALLDRNRALGEGVQFRNSWRPGHASLAFGLRRPGDSAELRIV